MQYYKKHRMQRHGEERRSSQYYSSSSISQMGRWENLISRPSFLSLSEQNEQLLPIKQTTILCNEVTKRQNV